MTDVKSKVRMMYVYFNEEMNITGISPVLDTNLVDQGMHHTLFEVDAVRPFITGEKNISTHYLKADKKDPTKFEILARKVEINYIKTIDRFLTEVNIAKKPNTEKSITEQPDNDYHIQIINNTVAKTISFRLHRSIKTSILKNEVIETANITINGIPELDFFFTAKNDPSFLIKHVCVRTNELIGKHALVLSYDSELSYASLFTKKIFSNYVYEVIT